MENLILIDDLIKEARKKGVNFGKGDPYNRLRYYTKIGWLPNMQRKMNKAGNMKAFYPDWTVNRLIYIEKLKETGTPNEDITKKLLVKSRFRSILDIFTSKEIRNQVFIYTSFIMLGLILASEAGVLNLGKPKNQFTYMQNTNLPQQIIDNGTAFIPKNQKQLYIKTPLIKATSKVYVTFGQDYSPASRYWVSDINDYDGFLIELDAPVFNNAEFNWWISN